MRTAIILIMAACSSPSLPMLPPPVSGVAGQMGMVEDATLSVLDPRWGGSYVQCPNGWSQACIRIADRRFLSLGDAVSHAVDGDVIELGAGVFETDALNLDRDITIRGAGPGRTEIRSTGGAFMHVGEAAALSLSDLRLAGENSTIAVERGVLSMENTALAGIDGYAVTADHAELSFIDVIAQDCGGVVQQTGGTLEVTGSAFEGHDRAFVLADTRMYVAFTSFRDNDAAIEMASGSIVRLEDSQVHSNGEVCGGAICMSEFPARLDVVRSDLGGRADDNDGHDVYLDAATGDTSFNASRRVSFGCLFEQDHGSCSR